jgi:hypothetical protein
MLHEELVQVKPQQRKKKKKKRQEGLARDLAMGATPPPNGTTISASILPPPASALNGQPLQAAAVSDLMKKILEAERAKHKNSFTTNIMSTDHSSFRRALCLVDQIDFNINEKFQFNGQEDMALGHYLLFNFESFVNQLNREGKISSYARDSLLPQISSRIQSLLCLNASIVSSEPGEEFDKTLLHKINIGNQHGRFVFDHLSNPDIGYQMKTANSSWYPDWTLAHAWIFMASKQHVTSPDLSERFGKLVKFGIDFDVKSRDGLTPLAIAVYRKQADLVTLLLANGVNAGDKFDLRHDKRFSYLAAESNLFHLLALPCLSGQSCNSSDNPDKHEITDSLTTRGVDINAANADGETPLHIAAKFGDIGLMQCFVKHGAILDIKAIELYVQCCNGNLPLEAAGWFQSILNSSSP